MVSMRAESCPDFARNSQKSPQFMCLAPSTHWMAEIGRLISVALVRRKVPASRETPMNDSAADEQAWLFARQSHPTRSDQNSLMAVRRWNLAACPCHRPHGLPHSACISSTFGGSKV